MRQPPPTPAIANGFSQLAYVVPEIATSEQFFIDTLGIPGFFRIEDIPVYDSTYRGGPGDYGMHLSLGYAGDTQIELVQPLRGRSLYQEFLDAHGPGLQHLGYLIDDEPTAVRLLRRPPHPPDPKRAPRHQSRHALRLLRHHRPDRHRHRNPPPRRGNPNALRPCQERQARRVPRIRAVVPGDMLWVVAPRA